MNRICITFFIHKVSKPETWIKLVFTTGSNTIPQHLYQTHTLCTMVSSMVDNYNALINAPENNGKKRKMNDQPMPKTETNKTLKEQVFILTKIQENLLNFIGEKLDLSEEDLENIRKVGDISLAPVKRNPRDVPGIFTDDENRKYYINIHGAFVYKRPCGKPRKDKKWCHALGEWVVPGQDISEQSANNMPPADDDNEVSPTAEEIDGNSDEEKNDHASNAGNPYEKEVLEADTDDSSDDDE